MRGFAIVAILTVTALAGCFGDDDEIERPAPERAWSMTLPIDVNVVAVGFDDRLDGDDLLSRLPTTRPIYDWAEYETTRSMELEPIQIELDWKFHDASDDFAEEFFQVAQEAAFFANAPAFLIDYDRDNGHDRLQSGLMDELLDGTDLEPLALDTANPMMYIDAPTLEDWVQDNRARFGLDFPQPEYTFFLVDSFTNGYLDPSGYHYYYFDDGTIDADVDTPRPGVIIQETSTYPDEPGPEEFHTPKDPTSNRGWGGAYGFAWIDVGAAPSWMDYQPWYPQFEDDNTDHPVWDLDAMGDRGVELLHRNLAKHLDDGALVKILRLPIYDPEYRPVWHFPVHVFYETSAVSGEFTPIYGVDVKDWLIPERIEAAFADIAPWIETRVDITYYQMPFDDAGMAEAMRTAELYGNPETANSGVLRAYVRDNWDTYVPPQDEDTRVIPQFLFYFDGIWNFWGINNGGGFADADAWGKPLDVYNHIFDVCIKIEEIPCTKATKWQGEGSLDLLVIHEAGHEIGLTHARDTSKIAADGSTYYMMNWFWDSTWSTMTYRHQCPCFDQYDRDVTARGHTARALDDTATRIAQLRDAGVGGLGGHESDIRAVEAMLLRGEWNDAAASAVAIWDDVRRAHGGLDDPAEPDTVVNHGEMVTVATSAGLGGASSAPSRLPVTFPPLPVPVEQYALSWETTFAIDDGAAWLHAGMRDVSVVPGLLRQAFLSVTGPSGEYVFASGADVQDDAYVDHLPAGTYKAELWTRGGIASTYDVTLDVAYWQ